jgi:hypothetical protein
MLFAADRVRASSSRRFLMPTDHFPPTMNTWIDEALSQGDRGRQAVNRHLLELYAEPLRAYFLGSSFRSMGEPDDIVNGFFADRLSRPGFFQNWRDSGLRLRRWLMNALCFYLREQRRKANRQAHADLADAGELADPSQESHRDADRAFVRSVVQTALERGRADCEARRMGLHWSVFVRYHLENVPCATLAQEIGEEPGRVWVMIRSAQRRFAGALRTLLIEDGTPEDRVDEEIAGLLRASDS